jgi:hypothetical protein
MSYVITGQHRKGYFFPGVVQCGTWARNVSFGAIEVELDRAQAAGWFGLRATKELFG